MEIQILYDHGAENIIRNIPELWPISPFIQNDSISLSETDSVIVW